MQESLAIVLPVYNAQATLSASVTRALELATELTPRCEVVIIDDGSDDGTEEIACDLALRYPQVLVARHHRPRGMDEAIHTGVQATSGSILMIVPPEAELQTSEIRRFWRIGIGEEMPQTAATAKPKTDETPVTHATVIARLMKWGQALREEGARMQNGVYMIRRPLYRRRQSASNFQPNRLDGQSNPQPAATQGVLNQLRDLAFEDSK